MQEVISHTKAATITKAHFGLHHGQTVALFTLANKNGHEVKITNYGATITAWHSLDKQGQISNIVVGFGQLEDYLQFPNYHFGGIIGRYANRIANGEFNLDNNKYVLLKNNSPHHLHGGHIGFDQVIWDAEIVDDGNCLALNYLSKDGEEGYPGNLSIEVKYTLTDDNELKIAYSASTDKATHVNFTNHSYFNLSGNFNQNILNHQLQILADHYLPTDADALPTGEIRAVKNSSYNFLHSKFINADLLPTDNGYDHNFILNKKEKELELAAIVREQSSGRMLEVSTTEPGIQFYTGNFLDGKIKNSDHTIINKQHAFCLETQHYPDSPNQKHFPSTLLLPNTKFQSLTVYKLKTA
jgi:aldose 1-epimerase